MRASMKIAIGAAAGLAQIGMAYGHYQVCYSGTCSPHQASGSGGGSVFSNCSCTYNPFAGGLYWWRNFTCAAGTNCANGLCGSGKKVSNGSSYHQSTLLSPHGKAGGHSPWIQGYSCQ